MVIFKDLFVFYFLPNREYFIFRFYKQRRMHLKVLQLLKIHNSGVMPLLGKTAAINASASRNKWTDNLSRTYNGSHKIIVTLKFKFSSEL